MKTLNDGNKVPCRGYHFLLDWNETNNWQYIRRTFNKYTLRSLTLNEYKMLFAYATSEDYKNL